MTATSPVESDAVQLPQGRLYDSTDVARVWGIEKDTVRIYVHRTRMRIAEHGERWPSDLPLPIAKMGGASIWDADEVDEAVKHKRPVGVYGPPREA